MRVGTCRGTCFVLFCCQLKGFGVVCFTVDVFRSRVGWGTCLLLSKSYALGRCFSRSVLWMALESGFLRLAVFRLEVGRGAVFVFIGVICVGVMPLSLCFMDVLRTRGLFPFFSLLFISL